MANKQMKTNSVLVTRGNLLTHSKRMNIYSYCRHPELFIGSYQDQLH